MDNGQLGTPIAYNLQGAARATGMDPFELLHLARAGGIPARANGDQVLIEHDALVAYVHSLPAVIV